MHVNIQKFSENVTVGFLRENSGRSKCFCVFFKKDEEKSPNRPGPSGDRNPLREPSADVWKPLMLM